MFTPAAVRAAAQELFRPSHHTTGRQAPFETLAPDEQAAWDEDARAILTAAQEAQETA